MKTLLAGRDAAGNASEKDGHQSGIYKKRQMGAWIVNDSTPRLRIHAARKKKLFSHATFGNRHRSIAGHRMLRRRQPSAGSNCRRSLREPTGR